jgi:hypothetical protein
MNIAQKLVNIWDMFIFTRLKSFCEEKKRGCSNNFETTSLCFLFKSIKF